MAVQSINITQFLELAGRHAVLDVRSPGEYTQAHIPGAYSLPLFTDEERKIVGTAYKQQDRETAIKLGLDIFGLKMKAMVEEVEKLMQTRPAAGTGAAAKGTLLVHCWRGGMRSAGVAWLLDLYGFKVYTLSGGYKSYRNHVRQQFTKQYHFTILGGYTGSGKTLVLQALRHSGKRVVDLEALAAHKGSAFGALGEKPQPSQEMFENLLAGELENVSRGMDSPGTHDTSPAKGPVIYLEDESQRIGLINIPNDLWATMRNSRLVFVEVPFTARLKYITEEYGNFENEALKSAVVRIQKRLGGLETKTALGYLIENKHGKCFEILLRYYDKCYNKAMVNREIQAGQLNKLACNSVDVHTITNMLINEQATA